MTLLGCLRVFGEALFIMKKNLKKMMFMKWQRKVLRMIFAWSTKIKISAELRRSADIKGFVCGILGCLLANFDVKAGTELAWWVDKEYRNTGAGLKLLNAIEEKAKSLGIKYWNMVYMESSMPKQIKGIYESMGYIRNENLYTKRLM